jgi:hypothetical protein
MCLAWVTKPIPLPLAQGQTLLLLLPAEQEVALALGFVALGLFQSIAPFLSILRLEMSDPKILLQFH